MFYLVMNYLSENPWSGPEMLGIILDLFFIFLTICLVKEIKNEKQ